MASGSIFISKSYPTGLKILSSSLCSRAQKANYYKVALCFGLQKLRNANSDQLSRGHQFVCTPQPYSRECKVTTEEKREVLGLDKKKNYRNLDNLLQQRLPKQKEQRSRKQHEPHLLARKAGIHVEDSRSPQQVAANRKQSLTTVFQERKNKLFGQNMVKNFNTQDEFLIQKLRKVTNSPEPKTVLKEPLSGPRLDDYPTTAKPVSSFEELNIHPKLAQNLSRQNIFVPTEIQQYSILHLNKGSDIIIHSETGSGKTLAYLLPILQHPGKTGGNIIIVPSRELALQIHEVARSLLSEKKIAQVFVSGIEDEDSMIQRFRDTLPRILIGTPKALLKVIETNEEKFFDVSRIVLDEIDRLFLLFHGEKKKKKRKKITNHEHNKSYEMILAMLQSINNV